MRWTLRSLDSLPEPYDIIGCKWPLRERPGSPGPWVRPVLVRQVHEMEDQTDKTRYGAVTVSYVTGNIEPEHYGEDLIIDQPAEIKAVGLHKPSRFSTHPRDKKTIIWCEEWFAPSPYVVNRPLRFGGLNAEQIENFKTLVNLRELSAGRA